MEDITELVKMAANGDRAAFDSLYERTKNGVWFTCISLLKNEENAKDIMQDTYLAAFEKLNTLENSAAVQTWLNKIAANKCKNFISAKSNSTLANNIEEVLENIPDDKFLPEDYVMDAEKRRIIMDIIEDALSVNQYTTIILYYFDEMTVAEIAELMNCHEKTVQYRLKTARLKIKEEVERYEEENRDKLHAIVPFVLLTQLFRAQAESASVPSIPALPAASSNLSSALEVPSDTAAAAVKTGGKTMLNSLKAKIIAGACAAVVVGGGVTAGVLISNNSKSGTESAPSRPYISSESKAGNDSKPSTSQSGNYSQSTESAVSKPTTENTDYPKFDGLTPVKLIRTDENKTFRDPDIISGTIKDALLHDFLFLTEDGELVLYYNDGRDYQPISFGRDTGISNLDNVYYKHDGNRFNVLAVDGKNVFYKSVNRDGGVYVYEDTGDAAEIKGVLFADRDDIRDIRVDAYGDVVAFDGNGLGIKLTNRFRTYEEWMPSEEDILADDKGSFYYDPKYADGFYYNGMKVKQLVNRCFIAADNKIYFHRPGSSNASKTPVESLAEFDFERIYCPNSCDFLSELLYSAVTADGTIKVFSVRDEEDIKVLFSVPKPEGDIQNIWIVLGERLLVKTDKGIYSAKFDGYTELAPVKSLNGIGEEVISVSGYYVLLSNGCIYTVDEFRS